MDIYGLLHNVNASEHHKGILNVPESAIFLKKNPALLLYYRIAKLKADTPPFLVITQFPHASPPDFPQKWFRGLRLL